MNKKTLWGFVCGILFSALIINVISCTENITYKPKPKNPKAYCEKFAEYCKCPCEPIPIPKLSPDQEKLKKWYQKRKEG